MVTDTFGAFTAYKFIKNGHRHIRRIYCPAGTGIYSP